MITIGQLKELQEEYNLDDDTLLLARNNENIHYFYEDAEIEPVDYDHGLKVTRNGAEAIILTLDK